MHGKQEDDPQPLPRFASLDGLRGLAAAVVVVHHTMLLFPAVANPYLSGVTGEPYSMSWWLISSPLHLLWDGNSAVYIFFVLSGFVLFLPLLRSREFSWRNYYPKRLVRLYLPIWAAVVFAALSIVVVPRRGGLSSQWLIDRSHEVTLGGILRDLTLVFGHGGLVSPLWSLRWEIIFSLALPLYVFVLRSLRKFSWAQAAFCLLLVALGGCFGNQALQYLPMFLLGGVLALERARMEAATSRLLEVRASRVVMFAFLLVAFILLMTPWWLRSFGVPKSVEGASAALVLIGAGTIVFLAMSWTPLRAALCEPVFSWLGRISFSLYLIHEPVLIAGAFLLGDDYLGLSWIISIPAAFFVAWIFHRWIERPSHLLARRFELPSLRNPVGT